MEHSIWQESHEILYQYYKLESIQECVVKGKFKNNNKEAMLRYNFQSMEKLPVCNKYYVFTSSISVHLIL
jgi:hypothetical protein